ncbi:MAG: nucleoside recognition domain-containing protein [Cyclonatronaceae bacterium]
MLNYIWAGLIIFSLVFALSSDMHDYATSEYKNGETYDAEIVFSNHAALDTRQEVSVLLPGSDADTLSARWFPSGGEAELIFGVDDDLPAHWQKVAEHQDARNMEELRAGVQAPLAELRERAVSGPDAITLPVEVVLPEVHLVKVRAISEAAFEMAEFAVTLAIGLIGVMALWLGLMKIAEDSGLIYKLVKVVHPVLGLLFPNVPKDHPALGAISLNLSANMLGLGNAATPLGIKAMEELQKLNPDKDTATNAMCMFLTMNTASVQLVPPVTLIALLGVGVAELFYSILIATFISLLTGVLAASWYARRFPDAPRTEAEETA